MSPRSSLRKIAKVIDFSFIHERSNELSWRDNGLPTIDPVVLFKMLFIGYLFGIHSERQLVREIQVNVPYRWFLGPGLRDKVPDASTISQNRRRRFNDTSVAQDIFDGIVFPGHEKGTCRWAYALRRFPHLKANASKRTFSEKFVAQIRSPILGELEEAVGEDRRRHGKKPLKEDTHEAS